MYVGRGGRTNAAGVRQLPGHPHAPRSDGPRRPASCVLHLKSAVTALAGRIDHRTHCAGRARVVPHFVAVPEEAGAHVVCLGSSKLLMAADCPASARLLEDLGYEVISVDIRLRIRSSRGA